MCHRASVWPNWLVNVLKEEQLKLFIFKRYIIRMYSIDILKQMGGPENDLWIQEKY